ncbi:MAG: sigma 54-interacting transcriptional regulator [Planctomycetes bacterium]|nr:sigma 54-interacting transcriptional regulator [Planctomycetota bacterium]
MKLLGKARRYRILETLGKGGSGTVYRAFDSVEKRELAIKVLNEDLSASLASLAGDEFRLLASHTHANLVQVYDYGTTTDGLRYFTMELLEGQDLLGYLDGILPDRSGRGEAPALRELLDQVLAALDYIHSRGLVHQDLKPQNILVSENDGSPRVKLIDFGLSRTTGTESRELSGTIEYLAPEILEGGASTAQGDLYSFGIILYEIFQGRPPFHGKRAEKIIRGHLKDTPAELDAIAEPYRELAQELLEKDPKARPACAEDVRHRLPGARERSLPSLPAFSSVFVGREAILSRLLERLTTPGEDGPAGALLLGPTGMGKTRLLRELQVRAQVRETAVYMETCREEDRPGALLYRLLERVAAENDAEDELLSRLEECLADLQGTDAARGASLESFHYRVTNLLGEISRDKPCSIVIDDLQWADSLSLHTIAYLARRGGGTEAEKSPRLFLACRLDGEDDLVFTRTLEDLFNIPAGLEKISLEGLGPDEVAAYVERLLGHAGALPEELRKLLQRDTAGNPFYIEEYLRLLGELGGFERKGSSWTLKADVSIPIPGSLADAANRRLENIEGLRRKVLDAAAVLARPFSREEMFGFLAFEATDAPRQAAMQAALDGVVLDQLLKREGSRYSFAHAALEQASYAALDPKARSGLHGKAADWIQQAGGPGREPPLGELARHLFFSDHPARARESLELAGRQALRRGGLREAATCLDRALEVSEEPRAKFSACLLREEVWGRLGRKEKQREDLECLRELAEELDDEADRGEVTLREALYLDSIGKRREALGKLDAMLESGAAEGPLRVRLLSRRGMFLLFLSEFSEAESSLRKALEIAGGMEDQELRAECLQLLGSGHYLQGIYDEALAEMEGALAIRRELGDGQRAGALESNIGLIRLDRGELEAAEVQFKDSLKTFRRIGMRSAEAGNLVNLGLVYTEMGRLERALDFISEALQIRQELANRQGIGTDLGNLGAVWMRIGKYERAVPLLKQAIEIASEVENMPSLAINASRLAAINTRRGETEAAEECLSRARKAAAEGGGSRQGLEICLAAARLHLHRGEAAEALGEIDAALELPSDSGARNSTIECLALRASALIESNALEEADRVSLEAANLLEEYPGWLDCSQDVWFTRHRTLVALHTSGQKAGDPDTALRRAYTLLREKADAFEDPELRSAFMEGLPLHRDIDRAHAELLRRIREEAGARERAFYEIAKSLHSIGEIDPLLDHLLELAIETTRAGKGLILLRGRDGTLTIRAVRGMQRESVTDATEICQSVIEDVTAGGTPVLATDASSDERFRQRESVISFKIQTLMCVPLSVRDEVLGAVYVDGRGTDSFSTDDLDFLVSFAQLAAIAIDNANLMKSLKQENIYLRKEVETRYQFQNLICNSEVMQQLAHLLEKVSRSDVSILVTGETGTGKSMVARAVHYASTRSSKPFVTVDCGALPENLLESELFGHLKGAFSGAVHDRTGLIEEADGGTLFLDEISNTTLDLQAKLLRVLQEGEIRKVGENKPRKVDVRVLAATNSPIREAVEDGTFREDLFYRLNVVPVEMPPLRERKEDISTLAMLFLEKACERSGRELMSFTEEAMSLLEAAPWRGNVRELENSVEKLVILTEDERIDGESLGAILPGLAGDGAPPRPAAETTPAPSAPAADELPELDDFDRQWQEAERRYLLELVEKAAWNLSAAGRLAGVRNRNTLVSRLRKHGIRRPRKEK